MSFHARLREAIKVSDRNHALRQRLRAEDVRQSLALTDKLEEDFKEEYVPSRSASFLEAPCIRLEPGTCFLWYIVNDKLIRDVIPDFEIYHCKKIFNWTLQRNSDCHEALFGLGKLLAHSRDYQKAFEYMRRASKLCPHDSLYKVWNATLRLKVSCKTKREALSIRKCYEDVLYEHPGQLEAIWGLMELAFSGLLEIGKDIEHPKFYASSIKEIDEYYGYIAWSKILLKDKDNVMIGVNALKEIIKIYPKRPEAYLKLWIYYYSATKNYPKAEDIAAEAFLRVSDAEENHYHILFCIFYAKSFFKNGKVKNSLDFLQHKFVEHANYPIFMFHYAKMCIKTQDLEIYSISILIECLRMCELERHGFIYYWLSKAYLQSQDTQKAYETMKRALKHLPISEEKKRNEIQDYVKRLEPKYETIITIEKRIQENEIDDIKESCDGIQEYEPDTSLLLRSQFLYKEGDTRAAIDLLYNSSSLKSLPYLIQFLEQSNNRTALMEKLKEYLQRTSETEIPVHLWLKAVIKYSNALARAGAAEKALMLLKCIAKVFYPFSFALCPFTKALNLAETLDQMSRAANCIMEPSAKKDYYSITRLEKIQFDALQDDGEDERVELSSLVVTEGEDEDFECVLSRGIYNNASGGFSLNIFQFNCDPIFLYHIGKISCRFHIDLDNGLCALNDFLSFIRYEMNEQVKEIRFAKASYWKVLMTYERGEEATDLVVEVLPLLKKLKLSKKVSVLENLVS